VATAFDPSPLAARVTAEAELRDRDLGFGSVVSRESRLRLLNRDGSFNVIREGLGWLGTLAPYHLLLTISWLGFIAVVALLYLVDLATRYVADRQAEAGARLGVLGTWLLPVLLSTVECL